MRREWRSSVFIIVGMFLVLSCVQPKVDVTREIRSFRPDQYQEVFDKWTREFQILPVDGIENVLTARATYLSHEFRWAYVVRVAYDLQLSPDERQELNGREFRALDQYNEFFVTVMSGISGSDDLDPQKNIWHIRLSDDRGQSLAPSAIEKIRKPTINEMKYFVFDKGQRTAYRIRFPAAAPGGRRIIAKSTRFFTLSFSSALGQSVLRWETTKN